MNVKTVRVNKFVKTLMVHLNVTVSMAIERKAVQAAKVCKDVYVIRCLICCWALFGDSKSLSLKIYKTEAIVHLKY